MDIATTSTLVWAKMRYFPYWPAKIVNTPPELGACPKNKNCVLFFGTKQFGFVERNNIENYVENREKFIKRGKGADFRTAIQHMDEFIADNMKFHGHAYVKPIYRKIKVKTERDIQNRLGMKIENDPCDFQAQTPSNFSWEQEKKKLIDELVSLKSENLKITCNLHEKDTELKSSGQAIERNMFKMRAEFSNKLENLEKSLLNATTKNQRIEKIMSDLKRENNLLVSQNKQLTVELSGTENQNDEGSSSSYGDNNKFFKVERLLDDKVIAENHYLVRWKGFDSTHDSWEARIKFKLPEYSQKI